MSTGIDLHHLGEAILEALLRDGVPDKMEQINCKCHPDCNLREIYQKSGVGRPESFRSNVRLQPVEAQADRTAADFDGSHGVDVVAFGKKGLAFEAKLGLTNLSLSRFKTRFFSETPAIRVDKAGKLFVKGNMIGLLHHRCPIDDPKWEIRTATPEEATLAEDWVLVLRTEVWNGWKSPELGDHTHVLLFEDVVDAFGGAEKFDELVTRLIGNGFHESWGLAKRLDDPK